MQKKTCLIVLCLIVVLGMCLALSACARTTQDDGSEEHTHSLCSHEAIQPTCTKEGNIAYWSCECGKYFSDALGTTEIELSATVVGIVNHNYVDGVCSFCGNVQEASTPVVSAIYFNVTSVSAHAGSTVEIVATVSPSNATDKSLVWSSSNPSVATVQDGTVNCLVAGVVAITAYSSNGISAECIVEVLQNTDFRLERCGDGYAVTEYVGDDTVVTLPSTHGGKSVIAVGNGINGVLGNSSSVTSVTFPNTIQTINAHAFDGCNFNSVVIPNSVKQVSDRAFDNCTIDEATVPLCAIVALKYCFVKSIVLTDGEQLPQGAFANWCELQSATLLDTMTAIGDNAFYNCSSLSSVNIPINAQSIGNSSFEFCTGLADIYIPHGVTHIGDSAFYGCVSLTAVVVPESVVSIGSSAFGKCTNLNTLTIPFVGATKDDSSNTSFQHVFTTDASLPNLNSVPQSLNKVIITGGSAIYDDAFNGCKHISTVIADGVTSIGRNAFANCSGLTSVTLGNSVQTIGKYAFANCVNLSEVTISCDLQSVDGTAFDSVGSIDELRYLGNMTSWCEQQISGRQILLQKCATVFVGDIQLFDKITIPHGAITISCGAFAYCDNISSITIPNSVVSIGDEAFVGCRGLADVTVPNSVSTIGNAAFADCSGLTSVTMANGVHTIGNNAFRYCDSLVDVIICDTVTVIGGFAFADCSQLVSVNMGRDLAEIGPCAFCNCTNLSSVRFQTFDWKVFDSLEDTSGTAIADLDNSSTVALYLTSPAYQYYQCWWKRI